MARCLDCDGTGQAGGRDLTTACPTCNGEGVIDGGWADDDARDSYLPCSEGVDYDD